MSRWLRAAMLAVMSLTLAGCDLLYSYIDPFALDPGALDELPTVTAYGKGKATMEFTQGGTTQTITMGRVDPNSVLDSFFGAAVTWENDQGWTMTLNAYEMSNFGEDMGIPGVPSGDVTITLIDGHEYWVAGTYTALGTGHGCVVDVWEMSVERLSGRVNCTALKWTDGINPSFEQPAVVSGEEPFDVTMTFEAEPSEVPPGNVS